MGFVEKTVIEVSAWVPAFICRLFLQTNPIRIATYFLSVELRNFYPDKYIADVSL